MTDLNKIQISRNLLAGMFLRPFGFRRSAIRLTDTGVQLLGGTERELEFGDLSAPLEVTRRAGFPSEIVDDPLLDLVLPKPEEYDHAEERRLFYVALTRARKSVTVLADRQRPSVFARELIENTEYGADELGEAGVVAHRCGACGGRMLSQTSKKGNVYFQCEHRRLCGEMLRPCSECGKDLPVADKAHPGQLTCSCGAIFPFCPECSDGWLVERKVKWGPFLGCVNFPKCKGKMSLPKNKSNRWNGGG